MKLRSMDIKGFRGLTELHVDFHQRLTVIVGENGIGKTSVLDALAILLDQYLARYVRGSAQKARQIKDSDIGLLMNPYEPETMLRLVVDVSAAEDLEWTLLRQGRHEKLTSPRRSEFDALNAYVRARAEERGPALAGEPLLVYYGQRRAVLDVPQRLRDSVGLEPEAAFHAALDAESLDFREFVAWFRDRSLDEAIRWRELPGHQDNQLQAVRQAMTQETGLADPVYRTSAPRGLYVEKRQKSAQSRLFDFLDRVSLPVDQLSSGEKTFLALAGDLARRLAMLNPEMERPLEGEGIVLIDEVELHLHPRWQRRFIPWLMETFPNCQFVVTTHSPQVLGEVEAACIRILRTGPEGALDVLVPRETYGWDSNYILQSVLGADERSQEVKARLDELENAISDGALDRAAELLAGLRRDIEGNPPELTIAQARLDRRQRRGDA